MFLKRKIIKKERYLENDFNGFVEELIILSRIEDKEEGIAKRMLAKGYDSLSDKQKYVFDRAIEKNTVDKCQLAKTEHSHPLGMVVSTHFRCGKGVKRGLKNGALPFNID